MLQSLYFDVSSRIFSLHNAGPLRSMCERDIVLKDGKIAFNGSIAEAIIFNYASGSSKSSSQKTFDT